MDLSAYLAAMEVRRAAARAREAEKAAEAERVRAEVEAQNVGYLAALKMTEPFDDHQ